MYGNPQKRGFRIIEITHININNFNLMPEPLRMVKN